MDNGVFFLIRVDVFSLMRRFPVAIKQITLSKFVSVEDVNSKGRGNNEY